MHQNNHYLEIILILTFNFYFRPFSIILNSPFSMRKILFPVLLSLINSAFVQGPIELPMQSETKNIVLTTDEQTMVATFTSEQLLKIFRNNKHGFELFQTIHNLPSVFNLGVNEDIIAVGTSNQVKILEIGQSGLYEETQIIAFTRSIFQLKISSNSQYMIVSEYYGPTTLLKRQNGEYHFLQDISTQATVEAIAFHENNDMFVIGGYSREVKIYQKQNDSSEQFNEIQSWSINKAVWRAKFHDRRLMVSGKSASFIQIYTMNDNDLFSEPFVYDFGENSIRVGISDDFSILVYSTTSQSIGICKQNNGTFELVFQDSNFTSFVEAIASRNGLYYIFSNADKIIRIYYACPSECTACSFPNNCSGCIDGYRLQQGVCHQINNNVSHCVGNKFIKGTSICEEYCSRKCKTCFKDKCDCVECADFYTKNEKGECVIENTHLSIFIDARPFLNLVRRKGLKWIFMVVDDLWLYQYHKQEYDGIVKVVFRTISFIEQRQWEIIGLDDELEEAEEQIEDIQEYNAFSNEKYMKESRKNNFMLASLLDFFMFYTPFTVVVVFIFNRLFYLLFDYSISQWFRPYSFWFILLDLLIQNNLQYFIFLGTRTLDTMFSFTFTSKSLNGFFIIFIFVLLGTAFTSYLFYLHRYQSNIYRYKKMARYFLNNLYRFHSSYVLMIIQYGVKPVLKGFIHAFLFEYWVLQVYLLLGMEVIVFFITLIWQVVGERHKSRVALALQLLYSAFLVWLNALMLCKYEYFKEDEEVKEECEMLSLMAVYLMIITLLLRFLVTIKEALFPCKCRSNPIVPQLNGKKGEEKKEEEDAQKDEIKEEEDDDENSSEHSENSENSLNSEGWRYFERKGEKFVDFDFGNKVVRLELGEIEEDRQNKVIDFYMKRHEEYKAKTQHQIIEDKMQQMIRRHM